MIDLRLVLLLLGISFIQPVSADATKIELGHTCSYFGEHVPHSVYTFASDAEAENIVSTIMQVTGLPANFSIKSAGVPNAAAVVIANQRFILYNQSFMYDIRQKTGSVWAAYSIMAHEIGHHLSGHTLDEQGSRPNLELQADRYSGFILQKLGASLNDAKLVMERLGFVEASATHPAQHDRLAAISNGWLASCKNDSNCSENSEKPQGKVITKSSIEKKLRAMTLDEIEDTIAENDNDYDEALADAIAKELDSRRAEIGYSSELHSEFINADNLMKSEVRKMQKSLNKLRCGAGVADGIYGQKTANALIRFANSNYVNDANLISKIRQIENQYNSTPNDGIESQIRRTKLVTEQLKLQNNGIARFGKRRCY